VCVQPGETSRGFEEDKSLEGAARSGLYSAEEAEACLLVFFSSL
jgi:hypothetical protein